jgi:hypothetical protein
MLLLFAYPPRAVQSSYLIALKRNPLPYRIHDRHAANTSKTSSVAAPGYVSIPGTTWKPVERSATRSRTNIFCQSGGRGRSGGGAQEEGWNRRIFLLDPAPFRSVIRYREYPPLQVSTYSNTPTRTWRNAMTQCAGSRFPHTILYSTGLSVSTATALFLHTHFLLYKVYSSCS